MNLDKFEPSGKVTAKDKCIATTTQRSYSGHQMEPTLFHNRMEMQLQAEVQDGFGRLVGLFLEAACFKIPYGTEASQNHWEMGIHT